MTRECDVDLRLHTYHRCTGDRGRCGNTYVRDEDLRRLLADVVRQVVIPAEIAGRLAAALRESQADKDSATTAPR